MNDQAIQKALSAIDRLQKNCGIGSGGFQPGNTCARGGGGGGRSGSYPTPQKAARAVKKANSAIKKAKSALEAAEKRGPDMKKVRELKKMYDAKSKEIAQHAARADAARKRIEALKAQLNKKSIKEDLDHEQRALKKSVEALEILTVEVLDIARKAEKL